MSSFFLVVLLLCCFVIAHTKLTKTFEVFITLITIELKHELSLIFIAPKEAR